MGAAMTAATMRAVVLRGAGGPEVLALEERPRPEPGPGQIRVRVRAAGLNRADLLQRRGRYPAPPGVPADIPGLEYAGDVDAVGPEVRAWQPGDRVMGIVGGGAMAEFVVVHEREAMPAPRGLDWSAAAAIPEAFLTAWDGLLRQLALQPGEWAWITAVGSGVGTAALQLAWLVGARTVGSSRSPEKLARARALGLEAALVHDESLPEAVRLATGGRGADVLFDLVVGSELAGRLAALAPRGRALVVGTVAGARVDLDLGWLMSRRLRLQGTVLRARPLEEKIALAQAFGATLVPLFELGRLQPVLDVVWPMERVAEAHARLEANASFGKIVLVWA